MKPISFNLFGVTFLEPNIFLSDFLLALACFYFGYALKKHQTSADSPKNWHLFFYLMAYSSLIGAFGHLLSHYTGIFLKLISWTLSLVAVFKIELLATEYLKKNTFSKILPALVCLKTLAFGVAMWFFKDFFYLKIYSAIGLLGVVVSIFGYLYLKTHQKSYLYLVLSILSMVFTAIIHALKPNLYPWFTYNDAGHYLLIVCFGLLFLAAKKHIANDLTQRYQASKP